MALLRQVKGKTLREEWQTITLVFAELITLGLVIVQVLELIGLRLNFVTREIFFKPSCILTELAGNNLAGLSPCDPTDIVVLAIAVAAFALLYLEVKKRMPSLYLAQKKAPGIIKMEAKGKLAKAKEPQAPALLLIEFFFVAAVIIALRAYFDPQIELIPWSRVGIGPPITTAVNVVIAILVLAAFYKLYSYTASYRKR